MKSMHVNDFEIQKFAFDQAECEPNVIEHIHSCEGCMNRVEVYTLLSDTIKDQLEPKLDYNLSELVLAQLPADEKTEPTFAYLINFLIMASVGLVISTLYLFKDTLLYLLSDTLTIQTCIVISIAVFISFILALDIFRSFSKKINMLDT